jgi:hypothetical protein
MGVSGQLYSSGCFIIWGKSPLWPLQKRVEEPQSWPGCIGEERIFAIMENEILMIVQPIICALYQLNYPGFRG